MENEELVNAHMAELQVAINLQNEYRRFLECQDLFFCLIFGMARFLVNFPVFPPIGRGSRAHPTIYRAETEPEEERTK